MKINNFILPETTIIKFSSFPKRDSRKVARATGIEHETVERYNNWVLIDNKWYYYKNFPNYYDPSANFLNELIGEFIAEFLDMDTIRYSIGELNDENGNVEYGLLSESFRKKGIKYIIPQKLYLPRNCINLNNLDEIRYNCKTDDNYRRLVSQILKMVAIDVYMHQTDREERNYLFKKENGELLLAPLYDYEESFFVESRWKSHSPEEYKASFFGLNMNDADEIKKHPELIEIFRTLLSLDMKIILESIEDKHHINIDGNTKGKYEEYSKKRKELIATVVK